MIAIRGYASYDYGFSTDWNHFAFTFDGSLPEVEKVKLYINNAGVQETQEEEEVFGTLGQAVPEEEQ